MARATTKHEQLETLLRQAHVAQESALEYLKQAVALVTSSPGAVAPVQSTLPEATFARGAETEPSDADETEERAEIAEAETGCARGVDDIETPGKRRHKCESCGARKFRVRKGRCAACSA
jgi:Zn finger protein HypA/HybF involved in hydrogenase expression